MQTVLDGSDLEFSLQQLNTTAHKIGRTLKGFAKFLLAVLVYFVLNVCVVLLFNNAKPTSLEFVRLFEEGLRVFASQNVTIIWSILTQYRFVALSIVAVATALSWILEFSDKADATPISTTQKQNRNSFSQKAVRRVSVFSYKQHVAFLA